MIITITLLQLTALNVVHIQYGIIIKVTIIITGEQHQRHVVFVQATASNVQRCVWKREINQRLLRQFFRLEMMNTGIETCD